MWEGVRVLGNCYHRHVQDSKIIKGSQDLYQGLATYTKVNESFRKLSLPNKVLRGCPAPAPPSDGKVKSLATQSCLTLCNPWTAACQASLFFTISWSLLKLISIELMMCYPTVSSGNLPPVSLRNYCFSFRLVFRLKSRCFAFSWPGGGYQVQARQMPLFWDGIRREVMKRLSKDGVHQWWCWEQFLLQYFCCYLLPALLEPLFLSCELSTLFQLILSY